MSLVTKIQDLASRISTECKNLRLVVGNRTYTNDNVVTDGESITASIDALDTALGDINTILESI